MVLKHVFAATIGAMLAWGGPAVAAGYQTDEYQAQEYQADEFLDLDLSKAVLSPKPLGPPTQFAPVPVRPLAATEPESPPAPASTNSKAISERALPKPRIAHQA